MKRLFENNDLEWSKEALEYDNKIGDALRPIFEKAMSDGYSLRELVYITQMSSLDLSMAMIINKTYNVE